MERTPAAMPLHRREALDVMERAYDYELHSLVGFKGEEPVGLLPVFEKHRGPLTFVYSPPTELDVPYMGPVLLGTDRLKQRKAEQWNRRFVDGCLERVDEEIDPDFVDVRAVDRYDDPRPFIWNGFDVEPAYTHVVDLTLDGDALLDRFSSDARRKIRNADEDAHEIETGGPEDIRRVVRMLRERIDAKDQSHGFGDIQLDPDFAVALYDRLPEGYVRPVVCRVDGEFAGGVLLLERGDTVYRWHGAPKTDVDLPVNELLDWHVITTAPERDRTRYDLVGGMIPSVSAYKAKFNTEVRPIYVAQSESRRMKLASSVYGQLPAGVKSTLGV